VGCSKVVDIPNFPNSLIKEDFFLSRVEKTHDSHEIISVGGSSSLYFILACI
jgi:hypothetical protein